MKFKLPFQVIRHARLPENSSDLKHPILGEKKPSILICISEVFYKYTYYLYIKETQTRKIITAYVCVHSEKTVLEETHQIDDNDYFY